jgi:hypothetical protein
VRIRARTSFPDLYYLFGALLSALRTNVVAALQEIIPVAVGPMSGPSVGMTTRNELTLDDVVFTAHLLRVADAPSSNGGVFHMLDSLNPTNDDDRATQAEMWLRQLLLDSHFRNVDKIISDIAG